MARLGDVVEQIRGVSYKPEDLHIMLDSESIALLRANNIQDGYLFFEDVVYVDRKCVKEVQHLRKDDILICTSSGSKDLVGKAAVVKDDVDATFGAFCKVIRVKKQYPQYVARFFDSPIYRERISRASAGANINNIRGEHIAELDIPIPSLEAQRHIAAVLDKVSDLIALRKQQLVKLDELVKARFVEMFGGISESKKYPYKHVNEFTSVISGGTPSREVAEYWDAGTIPWIKTTELQNNVLDKVEEHITEKGLSESAAKIVPAKTILIAMYGQGKTRGMTAYLPFEAATNQACACILPSESINQKYLWQYFILSYDKLRDMAKGGNQPNLNGNMIKEFPVLFPPMEQQDQFADYFEQISQSKATVQQGLDKLETLKSALMQEYFG